MDIDDSYFIVVVNSEQHQVFKYMELKVFIPVSIF